MKDAHSPGTPVPPQPGVSRGTCPHLNPGSRLTHGSHGGGRGGRTDSTSGRSGHYAAQPAPHCRHPTAGRERRGEGHPRAERNHPPRREGYSSTNSGPMGRRPQLQFTEAPGAGVPPHLPQEPASPQPRQRPRDTCLAAPGFGFHPLDSPNTDSEQ